MKQQRLWQHQKSSCDYYNPIEMNCIPLRTGRVSSKISNHYSLSRSHSLTVSILININNTIMKMMLDFFCFRCRSVDYFHPSNIGCHEIPLMHALLKLYCILSIKTVHAMSSSAYSLSSGFLPFRWKINDILSSFQIE